MNENEKERLEQISERLAGVAGKPWVYEPKHEMFVGTTNALNTYYDVIDLGRNVNEWTHYEDENSKGYRRTAYSIAQNARIKALGEFLERCREDMQFLLNLHTNSNAPSQ